MINCLSLIRNVVATEERVATAAHFENSLFATQVRVIRERRHLLLGQTDNVMCFWCGLGLNPTGGKRTTTLSSNTCVLRLDARGTCGSWGVRELSTCTGGRKAFAPGIQLFQT